MVPLSVILPLLVPISCSVDSTLSIIRSAWYCVWLFVHVVKGPAHLYHPSVLYNTVEFRRSCQNKMPSYGLNGVGNAPEAWFAPLRVTEPASGLISAFPCLRLAVAVWSCGKAMICVLRPG